MQGDFSSSESRDALDRLRGTYVPASFDGIADVYVADLSKCDSCQPLVLGQVLEGMKPNDKPICGWIPKRMRST